MSELACAPFQPLFVNRQGPPVRGRVEFDTLSTRPGQYEQFGSPNFRFMNSWNAGIAISIAGADDTITTTAKQQLVPFRALLIVK